MISLNLLRRAPLLALCVCSFAAEAGIRITGTRVIYDGGERETSVKIDNDGSPRLIQAWVDEGDASMSSQQSTAPFVLTPPISRIDSGKGQTLRLIYTGEGAPKDRESVYWLNVLEIPPRATGDAATGDNHLQFAIRTRLKIFYRPKGLEGSPAKAHEQLVWSQVRKEGDAYFVLCTNPTAFNVSFNRLTLKARDGSVDRTPTFTGGGMCPARGSATLQVTGSQTFGHLMEVSVINDYGGFDAHEARITN